MKKGLTRAIGVDRLLLEEGQLPLPTKFANKIEALAPDWLSDALLETDESQKSPKGVRSDVRKKTKNTMGTRRQD